MTYQEPLSQKTVAIAISESADMGALGLAPEHLRDAMAEIARHLLAMGARLVYGGDLRANGFTELLFELVARHRRDADVGDARPAVINYLAWPIVTSKPSAELRGLADELAGLAELHFLDQQGADLPPVTLDDTPGRVVTDADWAEALTAMRAVLTRVSDARVVLGGRTEGYKGRMPGIAEEALTALEASQPLYLLGGFGGCARDIAVEMALLPGPRIGAAWAERQAFQKFNEASLRNGLTAVENATLAKTVHVDEAVALILRGLLRLAKSVAGTA
ncbi:hypothetical protein [uncultured Sphingomonas sp.]|uniref:hypothetical protein n=1 Tax=uncultured Sphingomonas sp. TaxID=158754 RepID=UPI0035CB13E5